MLAVTRLVGTADVGASTMLGGDIDEGGMIVDVWSAVCVNVEVSVENAPIVAVSGFGSATRTVRTLKPARPTALMRST